MPDDPRIISDRPVDEIPDPNTARRRQYQDYVERVRDTNKGREIRTVDHDAARAVYAGVKRAIERLGLEHAITPSVRQHKDQTASVYLEVTGNIDNRGETPSDTRDPREGAASSE